MNTQADPELLRIATGNYLSNAAKYGTDGGGVSLRARREGVALIVEVENEGAGFTAEEQAKLFGKFTRLNNALTRDRRGSGLGLYLTWQILELHGGSVSAESEPGIKTCFGYRLPVSGL